MAGHKKRFIIILSILLITGFFLTSFASYYASLSSLRNQIRTSQLPLTSDTIYSEIQRDLLKSVFIASIMASDTFLRDWILDGEIERSAISKYLKEIQTRYSTVTSFFVSDRTRNYYHSDGILKQVDPDSERDAWYFRVRDMQSDYEINIDPDMANKDTMTIFINHKVFGYQGDYLGATGVGLTITSVKTLIERYQDKYHRDIYFADRQGTITLHGSSFATTSSTLNELPGMSVLARDVLASDTGFFTYKSQGQTFHLNTRYLPEFKWFLLVQQTEKEATAKIDRALAINLLVCTLISAVILILANITISVYQKRIETMAITDKLTGLYNRHAFDILFGQAVKEIRRKQTPMSVILFDIDHFKNVNDTMGHVVGDDILQQVAGVAVSALRNSDLVFRWGGEEFLVLMKGCSLENASAMAEKLRIAVAQMPARVASQGRSVTVSLGVAEFDPELGTDSLLNMADTAMYRAKQQGRNRVGVAPRVRQEETFS